MRVYVIVNNLIYYDVRDYIDLFSGIDGDIIDREIILIDHREHKILIVNINDIAIINLMNDVRVVKGMVDIKHNFCITGI